MTSLFAMLGAHVTMLQKGGVSEAQAEVEKWGVADRVRLLSTDGGFDQIEGETFDAVFTKSVLWSIEHLGEFLTAIEAHLSEGGKVVFVENCLGGRCLQWVRRNVIRRGRFGYGCRYFGIRQDQLSLFRDQFDSVQVKRRLWAVYTILGQKKQNAIS